METRKAKEMPDEEFEELEKEQEGLRSVALGFKSIPQKKPTNYYNTRPGKGVCSRMRTFHVAKKKPKLWEKYISGEITFAELKAKL